MSQSPARPRSAWIPLALDIAATLVFAAVGRRSHDEGGAVVGVLFTAWPFLVGVGVAWLGGRLWRQPWALRAGVLVWVSAWAIGMALRAATGRGIAPSFMVVTAIVLAVLLLGWRLVARLARRRASASYSGSAST